MSDEIIHQMVIDVARMLAEQVQKMEDKMQKMEKKMEDQRKEILQHIYSKGTSICDGSIYEVPFPVVHLGRKLIKRYESYDDECGDAYNDLNILEYGGRSRRVNIQFTIHAFVDDEYQYPMYLERERQLMDLERQLMVHKGKFRHIGWSIKESQSEGECRILDFRYNMKCKEFVSTKYILDQAKLSFKDADLMNVFNDNIVEAVVWYCVE